MNHWMSLLGAYVEEVLASADYENGFTHSEIDKLSKICGINIFKPYTPTPRATIGRRLVGLSVWKLKDEWFLVDIANRKFGWAPGYYKCDGWDGLEIFLKSLTS